RLPLGRSLAAAGRTRHRLRESSFQGHSAPSGGFTVADRAPATDNAAGLGAGFAIGKALASRRPGRTGWLGSARVRAQYPLCVGEGKGLCSAISPKSESRIRKSTTSSLSV